MTTAILRGEDTRTSKNRMNLRSIDWIWNVRGSISVPPGQSRDAAFEKLAPLFGQTGTRYAMAGDALTFSKKDQPAQDKMSVFDSGTLWIEAGATGLVLRYRLVSRALLFCFMLPLLFLGFAGLTLAVNYVQTPAAGAAKKPEKPEKKKPDVAMNPIDKALGAPVPDKKKKPKSEEDKKPTPTAAYVFAGIFALLYVIGRILEARLVNGLFRRTLMAA